jgi:uncharacterized protein (TIRG00374 family)
MRSSSLRKLILPRPDEMITQKHWRWAAPSLALAALALVALRMRGEPPFDWVAFRAAFSGLDWRWLALAGLCAYTTYYVRALRWAVFLRPMRPRPGIWNLTKTTIIGFTAITLLGRPGEIVRPYLISRKEDVSLASQLAAWFLERLFDLLFALGIFGFGLSHLDASRVRASAPLRWAFHTGGALVWILSAICFILLILLSRYPEICRARLVAAVGFLHEHHLAKAEKLIDTFLQGVEALRGVRSVLELALYTALEWILITACYLCVTRSFAGIFRFGLVDVLTYMGFVAFGAVVQLPGIGGGMQVVSVLVLHELFGIGVATATGMTLILWIITFVILVPVGVVLALQEGLNWRSWKVLQEESAL